MPEPTKASTQGSEADRSQRRRRARAGFNDKKIADDEFMAAAIGDGEWLKQSLREAKGQINFDKNGLSSLHLAAIHGRQECLKLLIEKYKFDINMASTTGWRAVHLCISNQTGKRALQCLTYLLSKNADNSVANNDGVTPVHQAASEGHVQCLKTLIEAGAAINTKDCRGHTPLDLAKLWGHKKCARILAAESWHQGKDHVAKEMEHLKQLKLQQIRREMEDEDEYKAAQEFYGEKAYQDWLKKQNLPTQNTGPKDPRERELEKQQKKKEAAKKVSLYKANSKQQKPAVVVERDDSSRRSESAHNVHVAFRSPSPIDRKQTTFSDELYGLHETSDQKSAKKSPEMQRRVKTPTYVNPDKWKIPVKVPKKEYICNLTDDFPRDMYTKMPKVKSAPMYYDGRHAPSVYVTNEDGKPKRLKLREKSDLDLPEEVIDKYMSRDATRTERPVLFKSIHISDVNKKKKYELERKGRPEVALHLCDDFSSTLFQIGLARASTYHGSMPSTSSNKSKQSEWGNKSVPKENVVNAMRNIAGASRFPNIKGEEYVFNFGDVGGV